jgi:hypothetical protein
MTAPAVVVVARALAALSKANLSAKAAAASLGDPADVGGSGSRSFDPD